MGIPRSQLRRRRHRSRIRKNQLPQGSAGMEHANHRLLQRPGHHRRSHRRSHPLESHRQPGHRHPHAGQQLLDLPRPCRRHHRMEPQRHASRHRRPDECHPRPHLRRHPVPANHHPAKLHRHGRGLPHLQGDYILDSADPSFTLNSAGFIIERGALVETRLSGKAGDEWRKIGAGTLVISGTGNNEANRTSAEPA